MAGLVDYKKNEKTGKYESHYDDGSIGTGWGDKEVKIKGPTNSTSIPMSSSNGSTHSTTPPKNNLSNLPQYDIQKEIEKLRQAQTNAAVSSLGKARDQSLSNLNREKAQIAPEYYGKRNAASTGSQLQAKNFAEFMASRGSTSSGANAQAEMSRQGQLQGQIGSLNRDEAEAFTENSRRVSDVQNAYSNDVASAEAGIQSQYMQNMINELNAQRQLALQQDQFDRSFGLQEAGLTGMYNGQETMAAQAQALSKAIQEAQLLGQYNGQDTMAKIDSNRNYDFNVGNALGEINGQKTLANNQYLTSIDQWSKEYEAQQKAREFDEWLSKQNLSLSQQSAARAGSGGGGSSSASLSAIKYQNQLASEQGLAQSMQGLQNMASQGKSRSEILKFINSNAGDLQANGVPVQDLYSWANQNFTWDKDSNGTWYNTAN